MRFRNPSVVVLALALPLTWYAARRDLEASREYEPVVVRSTTTLDASSRAAPEELPGKAESSAKQELAAMPVGPARVIIKGPPHQPLALAADPTELALAAGTHTVGDVVTKWAALFDRAVTCDSEIRELEISVPARRVLDRTALRELLDFHDVVLVAQEHTLHAVHRRNLAQKFGPPWAVVADGDPVDPDALVTRTITIRNGAGNSIFATIRGLLTRDCNRIGNILYVQGPEKIILVDFARNVRYYEEIITDFDQPLPE